MSTFGVVVSTRGFFPSWLAEEGRKDILHKLEELGHQAIIISADETVGGVVETYSDAKKCAQLFKAHADEIKGILVVLPNFGDEVGVVNAIALADLNVPVLVMACDDDLTKMDIKNRRDAFCGKLSVCNNLKQYGIKYTTTKLHTCSINSQEFTDDISFFAKVCDVVDGVRGVRLGAIGTRPGAFQTVRFSEKILQQNGISVLVEDLSNIIEKAKQLETNGLVQGKVEDITNYGTIPSHIDGNNVIKQAKFSLAVEEWVKENECDAFAIQCWDVMQKYYGCASCLTMSMLGEKGISGACEMDVTGALTMHALQLAAHNPAGYMDWNNNYGDERDKCIAIHCSALPKSFINNSEFEISNLDILGASIGVEKCFGACKGKVKSGEMTFAKITTDDVSGKIRLYVGEGEFTDDPIDTIGAAAICKVSGLQNLMKTICDEGFEHHVAMVRTHCADVIEEALGKYMGFEVVRHR